MDVILPYSHTKWRNEIIIEQENRNWKRFFGINASDFCACVIVFVPPGKEKWLTK